VKGRKPKPVERQIAEGDPRKHGTGKLQEQLEARPKATRGFPACPKHLKGLGRSVWKFWADELGAMKLDNRPDAIMLEGACMNYARAVQAEEIIDRDGPTVTESTVNDDGDVVVLKVKAHPAVMIARQRWSLVKAFCCEFGLSPVSRMRLSVENKDEGEVDLMEMLSQPREQRPAVN
jgi:P27 family predicted phage terminase small subunit